MALNKVKVPGLSIKTILGLLATDYAKRKKEATNKEDLIRKHSTEFWTGALWAIQELANLYSKEIEEIDNKTYNIHMRGFLQGVIFTLLVLATLTFIFS